MFSAFDSSSGQRAGTSEMQAGANVPLPLVDTVFQMNSGYPVPVAQLNVVLLSLNFHELITDRRQHSLHRYGETVETTP